MNKLLLTLLAVTSSSFLFAQNLLFDQSTNVGTGGILCRTHTTPSSQIYDTEGADDFTIPSGEVWKIDSIVAEGFYNTTAPTATKVIVTVYADSSGMPGSTVVATATVNDGDPDDDGDLEPEFNTAMEISTGTYWLSMRIHTSSTPWYWARIPQYLTSSPFHWKNPGGGYGVCTAWEPLYQCITTIQDSSANFKIYGCIGPPQLDPLAADTTVCEGESVTLTANSTTSGVSYAWNNGATTSSITIDSAGTYEVTVTSNGGCSKTSSSEVTVIELPSVSIDDDTLCEGDSPITFQGGNCVNCQNTWNDGSHGFFYTTNSAGQVTVTLTDTIYGCSSSDTAMVTVESVNFNFIPGDQIDLCDGDTVMLSLDQTFPTYSWSSNTGSGWTNNVGAASEYEVTEGGLYAISVEANSGCDGLDTVTVIDRPTPDPEITFEWTNSWKVRLTADPGYSSYLWSNGNTTESITVQNNKTYTLTVTNEWGCEGEVEYKVTTVGEEELQSNVLEVYPNPVDDLLKIEWAEDRSSDYEVSIIDLSGRAVLTRTGSQSNLNIKTTDLPAGNYMIRLSVEGETLTTPIVVKH